MRFLSSPGSLLKRRESDCGLKLSLLVVLIGGMKTLFDVAVLVKEEVGAGMEVGAVSCSEIFAAIVE